MVAAQLLSAAKNADIQQVQNLINAGADVNYVDTTGLSIVCTALMNNDVRAAQILQMYGADASGCDRQIKQYKSKNKPSSGGGGLFSGLSSAQGLTLAAAGAAVVVGGLLLLTDVFDPGNDNDGGVSNGGTRPGGDGNGGTGTGGTAALTIPYGPAFFTSDGTIAYTDAAYRENLTRWDPSAGGIRALDFNFLRPNLQVSTTVNGETVTTVNPNSFVTAGITVPMQNYLLMMHGYSSFANGYLGQTTFRDAAHNPVYTTNTVGSGVPMVVSLITANGVNPTGSAMRAGGITYADGPGATTNTYTVDKYLNYASNCADGTCSGAENTEYFDFSGSGTAMNPFASPNDSALAKIIAGWESGDRSLGDLYGFVPNGRLAIFKTGNGKVWADVPNATSGTVVGTLTDAATGGTAGKLEPGDTITLDGKTYAITSALAGAGVSNPTIKIGDTTYTIAPNSTLMKGTCTAGCSGDSDIAIYVGADGYYYVNSTGGYGADNVYVIDNNNIYVQKTLKDDDFKNFEAMYYKARAGGAVAIANSALIAKSRDVDYLSVDDLPALFALSGTTDKKTVFKAQIDNYYDKVSGGSMSQGDYANSIFNGYNPDMPILIMPAGEFEYGQGAGKSLDPLAATFENYAPALYDQNLQHMFMTVVAVSHSKGTDAAGSISGYGNGIGTAYGPLVLSMWTDTRGTTETDDDILYSSRKCGIAGLGINGIDPWCFSATGPTAEMAAASAAGAVAAIKGAFPYMNNQMVFTLMALTADGPYLATNSDGKAFTKDELAAYLRSMYALPPSYYADTLSTENYLKAFAEVFGYGLINLERAMTPNKKIYFYDGQQKQIVSASGTAYWRAAADTVFRSSTVMRPRAASIGAAFYDILESADGDISMPRVWKNEFALGASDSHGLYMGDVLGDMRTTRDADDGRIQIGNIGFSFGVSQRPYADNMGGMDNMRLDYSVGAWNLAAGYQRYFTDGASRFDGMSNPILGLAHGAIVSDATYRHGNWSFGARAFSGAITDEGLLESDPTITAQYTPARLGMMRGAQSDIGWDNKRVSFGTAIGRARESNTLLGAVTGGLLNLGAGDTTYVDSHIGYAFSDDVSITARATFARTTSDASGQFILGLTDIDSNAFAIGAHIGAFDISVSRPLAITSGAMQYSHADFDVSTDDDGNFELNMTNAYVADVSMRPENRELRFVGTYRHNFGPFTDGAAGFIYRVNPNHTSDFGNESIFMLKMTHRIGI